MFLCFLLFYLKQTYTRQNKPIENNYKSYFSHPFLFKNFHVLIFFHHPFPPVWLPAIQKIIIKWHYYYVIFVVVVVVVVLGNTPRVNIICFHHYHIRSPFHHLINLPILSPPFQDNQSILRNHSFIQQFIDRELR